MKLLLGALLSAASVSANGPGFGAFGGLGFGPDGYDDSTNEFSCANSCVSSFWVTATPSPSAWCASGITSLGNCISSACTADSSDYSSYRARATSLCSEYMSCSSTGTYTYTIETPAGSWWNTNNNNNNGWFHPGIGGGFNGHNGIGWNKNDNSFITTTGPAPTTTPTGSTSAVSVITVTGCPWDGDGFGFPFWRGLGLASDFWTNPTAHSDWTMTTVTSTITETEATATITTTNSAGSTITTTSTFATSAISVVEVQQAVSGALSTERTVQAAAATATSTSSSGSGDNSTKKSGAAGRGSQTTSAILAGSVLGVFVAVVGMM